MKNQILNLLRAYHKGKGNAITVDGIALALQIRGTGATGYPIRKAIKELVQKDQIPIGSCARGFYIIKTEAERLEVIDNLVARQNGMSTRIRALRSCII